jgi:coenzyme F420-reducing hydrogenase delta subunit
MSFTPDIQIFCCHYTSQQAIAEGPAGLAEDGFPAGAAINRLPCSGKLRVSTLLKAFEDGADGVCVVGCPEDQCHNLLGSQRAAHRVRAVQKALTELGVESERIGMFHLPRGFHPEFIDAAVMMDERIRNLGPSPFKNPDQPLNEAVQNPAAQPAKKGGKKK